jgi:hypothetical protein
MAERQPDHMTKRIRVLIIALSLLVAVAGLSCTDSSLSPKDKILGNWRGSGSINEETVAVKLMIKSEEADLNFGSPLKCDAFAEYIDSDGRKHTYRFSAKTGGSLQGWCKNLRNEDMVLTQNDDATLSLNIQKAGVTLILKKEK